MQSPAMLLRTALRSGARRILVPTASFGSLPPGRLATPGRSSIGASTMLSQLGARMSPARGLFIQTEKTPNPSSLKFLPGREVLPAAHGTGMFLKKGDREYQRSPLALRLFKLEDVNSVFLGSDFVTVGKATHADWVALKPQIFTLLMDAFAEEGFEVWTEGGAEVVSDTTIHDDDDEIVAMIKELLETRIRPAVQEDGGDIFYVSWDEGVGEVRVQLAGSCSGCPSSSVTLKSGVENMLMHYIPEVKSVTAVDESEAAQEAEQKEFEKKNREAYFAKMDEKKAKEDEDPKAKAMREAVEKISK